MMIFFFFVVFYYEWVFLLGRVGRYEEVFVIYIYVFYDVKFVEE